MHVENDYKNKTNHPIIIISYISQIECIQCARNQNRHIELSSHLEIIKNFFFSAILSQHDDKSTEKQSNSYFHKFA